jgi:hypothetical protein
VQTIEIILVRHQVECHVRVEVMNQLSTLEPHYAQTAYHTAKGAAMHPNNPYATKKPDFAVLASKNPSFTQ